MDREWQLGGLAKAFNELLCAIDGKRGFPLGQEHEVCVGMLASQRPQQPQLVTLQAVDSRRAVLGAAPASHPFSSCSPSDIPARLAWSKEFKACDKRGADVRTDFNWNRCSYPASARYTDARPMPSRVASWVIPELSPQRCDRAELYPAACRRRAR